MTDMLRYKWTSFGPMLDEGGPFVLLVDAEAAIDALQKSHHDLCFLSDSPSQECICERLKQAENYARIAVMHTVDVDSYEQGQRDAIAAAVQRIEALLFPWPNTWPGMIRRGDVITAVRGES